MLVDPPFAAERWFRVIVPHLNSVFSIPEAYDFAPPDSNVMIELVSVGSVS